MSDADKTEDASPHKLEQARKRGQFARSTDVVTAAVLAASVAVVGSTATSLVSNGGTLAIWASSRLPYTPLDFRGTLGEMTTAAMPLALSSAIVMGTVMATGLLVSLIQTGGATSLEPLMPKFDRINPMAGAKRILSLHSLVDKAKMMLKAVVMVVVGYYAIEQEMPQLKILSSITADGAMTLMLPMATRIAWKLIVAAVILGVVDYAWQIFQFKKQMRMSRQELIDEHKMLEGDPHVKARQKRFRRQLIKRMRLDGVREARVVITNPTHFAVALAYGGDSAEIPTVVAKGKDHRAQLIKKIAKDHDVHIFEAPPLARSLYKMCDVGEHIPPALFLATAEILVMVDRLEAQRNG